MTYNTLSDDGNSASVLAASSGAAPDPNVEIVTIATYQSIVEADLVRSELESRGITAYVSGAAIAQTFVSMPETGISVQVASNDAAVARQVADELASATPLDGEDDEYDDVDGVGEEGDDFDTAHAPDSDEEYDEGEGAYDEDADAAEQVDAAEALSTPRSPGSSAALQNAYPDPAGVAAYGGSREAEVDIQRKPGQAQAQHMYDDAEAGG